MKKPLHYIRTTSVAKLLESLPFSTPIDEIEPQTFLWMWRQLSRAVLGTLLCNTRWSDRALEIAMAVHSPREVTTDSDCELSSAS